VAGGLCLAHQFCSLPEICVIACGNHHCGCLAALDETASVSSVASASFDGTRFVGDGRMVDQHIAIRESRICRNHVAHAQVDQITRHQALRRETLPGGIPSHTNLDGQPAAQNRQRALRMALLHEAQTGVEHQKSAITPASTFCASHGPESMFLQRHSKAAVLGACYYADRDELERNDSI